MKLKFIGIWTLGVNISASKHPLNKVSARELTTEPYTIEITFNLSVDYNAVELMSIKCFVLQD